MEVDATIQDENVEEDGLISPMKLAVSDDEDGGAAAVDSGGSQMDTTNMTLATQRENGGSGEPASSNCNKRKLLYDLRQYTGERLYGFDESGVAQYDLVENEIVEDVVLESECAAAPPKKSRPSFEDSNSIAEEVPSTTSPSTSGVVEATEIPEPEPEPEIVPDVPAVPVAPVVPVPPVVVPIATPQPVVSNKPRLPKDDFYKKPFECGWKRELVYRANPETSKDKADVYYIAPTGKKTRSKNEIIPFLEGDLTIEHFCFAKEPLGATPELEIVRSAKPTHRLTSEIISSPTTTNSGKRVSKPKAPKGASPPPQGWTPTRALKNSSSLNSNSNSSVGGSTVVASPKSTPKTAKNRKTGDSQPCTMQCAAAMGMVPQLQCIKCLCLYHHECVGLDRRENLYRLISNSDGAAPGYNRKDYVCQSCVPAANTSLFKENQATSKAPDMQILLAALSQPPPPPPPLPTPVVAVEHSVVSPPTHILSTPNATDVVPITKPTITPPEPTVDDLPQSIAVIKGKKYVVVKKPLNVRSTTAAAENNVVEPTLENDVLPTNDRSKRNNNSNSHRKQQANASASATNVTQTVASSAVQSSPPGNSVLQPTRDMGSSSTASSMSFASNFFANVSVGYGAILHILKYLKIHERPRAASVCKIWNLVAKDRSLWQTVRMKNSKVSNWAGFTAALRRGETKHLDLRKLLVSSTKLEETWSEFMKHIGTVPSLEHIDMCRCSAKVVESIFLTNPNLTILSALAINEEKLNLGNLDNLVLLEELRLRTLDKCTLAGDLSPLRALKNLKHLSLTSIRDLGTKGIEVIGELNSLVSLELGDCNDFDSRFTDDVLPKLSHLERLRLEIGQEQCRTLDILDSVAKLENLSQLEFVNFDIKPGFDDKLAQCTNIRKLLIIPTYISQSATTNNIVLNAVLKLQDTLDVFTWGVTVELLRVTALYVDQCEDSTKKERRHFDECIPVLKPVPGSVAADTPEDEPTTGASAVPQIEILPLDKVEEILRDSLFTTKFTIVKVPYHATWKQQLVE